MASPPAFTNNVTVADGVLVNNGITIGAKPSLSGSFDKGRLTTFRSSLDVNYDAHSKLAVSGDGEVAYTYEKKEPLFEKNIGNYVFFIGIIPVEVTVKTKLGVGCSIFASGKVEASTEWHAHGAPSTGVVYKDGQFTSIGNPTDFALDATPEVTAEANVGVKCETPLELDVFIYDVAGPFAALVPIARVSTNTSKCTPPKIGIGIDVYGEIRLGVKAEVLDHTTSWNWSKASPSIHIYPPSGLAEPACPASAATNECTSDTGCGAGKACSSDGTKLCCRTPAPSTATKCRDSSECPTGQVCGWNLEYFVCQAPACN